MHAQCRLADSRVRFRQQYSAEMRSPILMLRWYYYYIIAGCCAADEMLRAMPAHRHDDALRTLHGRRLRPAARARTRASPPRDWLFH